MSKKPHKPNSPRKAQGTVRFDEEVRVKNIKAKGKNLPVATMYQLGAGGEEDDESDGEFGENASSSSSHSDEEEELGQDEFGEEDSESNAMDEDSDFQSEDFDQREAIERLKDDLFADDDKEEDSGQ